MIGPQRHYRFKQKPWTLLDRIAVTFLAVLIALFGPILFLALNRGWRLAAEIFSFEAFLWYIGIVAAVTFLTTFFDRLKD